MSEPAVVLVNLGTPDSPALADVRRYLAEFLSDKRVVDLPAVIWQPVLRLVILRSHAPKSAAKYASVWTPEGSSLLVQTKAQVAGLRQRLGPDAIVECAMRYGSPGLGPVLDGLRRRGVTDVLLVPMYPQYSTTTVASITDGLETYLGRAGAPSEPLRVSVLPAWPTDAGYIEACARLIEAAWETHGRPDFAGGDRLLLSYHSIPAKLVRAGDPYADEVAQTTALLRARLHLSDQDCPQTYQSKFGKGKWLGPATLDTVSALGRAGSRRVDVFCPGFAADCLETCEEIGLLNRDAFLQAGGREFHRIDCLNASPAWLDALAELATHFLLNRAEEMRS